MKKKIKIPDKLATVLIVVLVVCASVAQFALAVNPGNVTVDVPNPYGASTLSLNDATTARTLFNSSTIEFGTGNGDYTYASQTAQITTGLSPLSDSYTRSNVIAYLNVPAGIYLDYICVVNYPASEWSSLIINGGGVASLKNVTQNITPTAYPDTVQLIVNGSPVGEPVAYSNGFTFPTITVPVSSDVYNIGYRFTYTEAVSVRESTSTNVQFTQLSFDISDNAIVTAIEKEQEDPYIPLLMANNSWLQSIFGNTNISNSWLEKIANSMSSMTGTGGIGAIVQALNPNVENSQGWYTKEIADAFDTETEGTVGNTIADIGSIYASEEDIALKQGTNEFTSAVTDVLVGNSSDGSSGLLDSDSDTDVKQLKNIGKRIKEWFSFDVDINELFSTVEGGGSDWYSQETANGIDSVPSTYSNEEDPYSMQDYYDYINYLFGRYGGDAE